MTIPSMIFWPVTYLMRPLLYFGFSALIAPLCASLIFWAASSIYVLHRASVNSTTFTFITDNINTTSQEIDMGIIFAMALSFGVICISAFIPLSKKGINLQQNQLWQLSLDYEYRLKFPLHFISLWFCCFGAILGLFWWPFWILKECKYCYKTIKILWNNDKADAMQNKRIPKPFQVELNAHKSSIFAYLDINWESILYSFGIFEDMSLQNLIVNAL